MRFFYIALAVLLLVCCTDKDNTKPVVTHLSTSQKSYDLPAALQISAAATDDRELVQSRLFITGAFAKTLPWKYTVIDDINGASFENSWAIEIPDSALAGYYSVSFGAVDASGNISTDSIRYFHIRKPEIEPYFTDLQYQPAATGEVINVAPGDTLVISGKANSPTDLDQIRFQILDLRHLPVQTLFTIPLQDSLCTVYNFRDTVILSEDLTEPEYFLVGRAADSTGNQRRISLLLQTR